MGNLVTKSWPMLARLVMLALLLLPSLAASAQPVSDAKEEQAWLGLVAAIVLALIVAIVSFMSPRRGHQD